MDGALIDDIVKKNERLVAILQETESLAVAFSGGIDSAFLLAVAHQVLGQKVIAITAESAIHPIREKKAATAFASRYGVRHALLKSREMDDADFTANTPDRCYVCKRSLFADIIALARRMGVVNVAHGANMDDLNDYRPGLKAAREMGVLAPLIAAEMTKDDIRQCARKMGLADWAKPAMACLASRIPYGTPITRTVLKQVADAEAAIARMGVRSCRVRHHGKVARIELHPDDFHLLLNGKHRERIVEQLKALGYEHIAMDLEGYVSGSLNRGIAADAKAL